MTKETSNKLYICTFIMTIFIIIFHCVPRNFSYVFNEYPYSNFISNYFYNIYTYGGSIALDFFFCQTGFFLYYKLTKENYLKKIGKRLKTLLIPFMFWNVLYLFVYVGLGLGWEGFKLSLNSIIGGFSFLPFDGPFWYIFSIIIFMLAVPFLIRIKDNKKLHFILFFLILALAIYISIFPNEKIANMKYYFCLERAIRFLPAYFLGAILAMNSDFRNRFHSIFNGKRKVLFIVLFILSTFLWTIKIPSIIEWIISRIRPLLLFGIIDERKFVNEVSQNVKFTFIIYASHYLIIDILFKFVFDRLNFINNYFVCIFLPLIIAAIVYFINYLLYSIIKKIKFKDKIFLLIAGGRG